MLKLDRIFAAESERFSRIRSLATFGCGTSFLKCQDGQPVLQSAQPAVYCGMANPCCAQ